LQIYIDYISVY